MAAVRRAVSRIGARRALRSFVRVGECNFSVEVEIGGFEGEGGGIVIFVLLWGLF